MAKKDDTEHEPLTEEQRITALEERVGTNKIVLLVVALILIITISVSVTIFTFAAMDDEEKVDITMIETLEAEVETLSKTVETQKNQIHKLKRQIPVLQEQLANSSNLKLQAIVMEQEEAHLEFIDALRTGMYDLAHMLPGSRTWLEVYGEKVDIAEAHAKSRVKNLKKLKKITINPDLDDDPFADGF